MTNTPANTQQADNNPWDNNAADGAPINAKYYDAMRSSVFLNEALSGESMEMMKAVRAGAGSDLWFVTKYTFENIDDAERGIVATDVMFVDDRNRAKGVPFMEALGMMGQFELMGEKQPHLKALDLDEKYPNGHHIFNELYSNVEDFEVVANIEGIVFDESKVPYHRYAGSIIGSAVFRVADLNAAMTAANDADPKLKAKIEGGILSDIFNSVSGTELKFDTILKVLGTLAKTDRFAQNFGGFYLSLQEILGEKKDMSAITGFETEKELHDFSRAASDVYMENGRSNSFRGLRKQLNQMRGQLDDIEDGGVYVEPFQKFLKEVEIYSYMLEAAVKKDILVSGMRDVVNQDLIIEINEGVSNAIDGFTQMGGPQSRVDELKGWVMSNSAPRIPDFIPGFINRYYSKRNDIMKKVEKRDASAAQDVKTMAADVKPNLDMEATKATKIKGKKPGNN